MQLTIPCNLHAGRGVATAVGRQAVGHSPCRYWPRPACCQLAVQVSGALVLPALFAVWGWSNKGLGAEGTQLWASSISNAQPAPIVCGAQKPSPWCWASAWIYIWNLLSGDPLSWCLWCWYTVFGKCLSTLLTVLLCATSHCAACGTLSLSTAKARLPDWLAEEECWLHPCGTPSWGLLKALR